MFADASPYVGSALALEIVHTAQTRDDLEFALQILEESAPSVSFAYFEVELTAKERNFGELAWRAANERVLHATQGRVDLATNHARVDAAAVAFRIGQFADAARAYQEVALSEPTAVRSVELAIIALAKVAPLTADRFTAFCRTLLSHGRAAQGIACVRSLAVVGDESCAVDGGCDATVLGLPTSAYDRLWLEAYAVQPVLDVEEIQELVEHRRGLRDELLPIARCAFHEEAPNTPGNNGLPLAAVYTRVLDGLSRREALQQSRCLLQAAAEACMGELQAAQTCSEPRSIGRYVDLLAAIHPSQLAGVIDGPLKGLFRDQPAADGKVYGRWRPNDVRATTALFNMHVSLAYALSRVPMKGSPYYEPSYHVGKARQLWRMIGQGHPFPKEALQGVTLPWFDPLASDQGLMRASPANPLTSEREQRALGAREGQAVGMGGLGSR